MEDVDSEKQKPLPFHFQTPCLQFTKDESKARIRWQAKGNVVANHKQHMVNSVSKENKTSLYSSWMPSAEAKRKHEALLAELRQGTSWLNMYQTTAKVCEPKKPLPHNFAMPMVELHPSDKTLARMVPTSMCRFTTRQCLECAINESRGYVTRCEDYVTACRVVQAHLYRAMQRPCYNILVCVGLVPAREESTIPMMSIKQKLLETLMDVHKTYLVAPYSKQFLRDRALADYFFVLTNEWHAPDLVPWDFDSVDADFVDARCDWRYHDSGYYTDTLAPPLRAGLHAYK